MFKTINISPVYLRKILPKVYLVSCKEQYDLGMLFLRVQEGYESEEERFRKEPLDILDYMRYYAIEKNIMESGTFSYPTDWGGFNVPSKDFQWLYKKKIDKINDYNMYDEIMITIMKFIEEVEEEDDYCIIGVQEGSDPDDTFLHELAHSMWNLNDEYCKDMKKAIKEIRKESIDLVKASRVAIRKLGYDKDVVEDEMQAYFSTGIIDEIHRAISRETSFKKREVSKTVKPCVRVFNKYLPTSLIRGPWKKDIIWEYDQSKNKKIKLWG